MANTIKFPIGSATILSMTTGGTQSFGITNDLTIIDGITVQALTARTLNLSATTTIETGAMVLVEHYGTGATSTLTYGTLMSGATLGGSVSGKTNTQLFIYNGTAFMPTSNVVSL